MDPWRCLLTREALTIGTKFYLRKDSLKKLKEKEAHTRGLLIKVILFLCKDQLYKSRSAGS